MKRAILEQARRLFLVPPQLVATPNVITVANKAEALASYAKQAKDESMHKMAERIQARAIRRCGELLKQIEPGKTGPKQLGAGAHTQLSRKDAATEAGLSKHQQVQAMRVANVPEDDFNEAVESDNPPTVTKLNIGPSKSAF